MAHKYGKTFVLIAKMESKQISQLGTEAKKKIQEALESCLVSDSHFEVIKANTEAFIGTKEENDEKDDNNDNDDSSQDTEKDDEEDEDNDEDDNKDDEKVEKKAQNSYIVVCSQGRNSQLILLNKKKKKEEDKENADGDGNATPFSSKVIDTSQMGVGNQSPLPSAN